MPQILSKKREHANGKDKSGLDAGRMKNGQLHSIMMDVHDYAQKHPNKSNSPGPRFVEKSTHEKLPASGSRFVVGSYDEDMRAEYERKFWFVDASGAYRYWVDDFIDYKGNWCSWGGTFYDKDLNIRSWGESFIDGKGGCGSLQSRFYDAAGNWIQGYKSYVSQEILFDQYASAIS